MTNIITFPIKHMYDDKAFDPELFDKCQNNAKSICGMCVEYAAELEEYPLTLAMACGYALSFIRDTYAKLWDEVGEYLEVIANGEGLVEGND